MPGQNLTEYMQLVDDIAAKGRSIAVDDAADAKQLAYLSKAVEAITGPATRKQIMDEGAVQTTAVTAEGDTQTTRVTAAGDAKAAEINGLNALLSVSGDATPALGGPLDAAGNAIGNLPDPADPQEPVTLNHLANLPAPQTPAEPVTRAYFEDNSSRFGLVSHLMNQSGNVNPTNNYLTFIMRSGDIRGIGYGSSNNYLGTGDSQQNYFTAATPGFDLTPHADGTPVRALTIESTYQGSIALMDNGEVWAWGYGGHGQIGDDSFSSRYYPRRVRGLNAIAIVDIASCGAGSADYCSFAALDDQGHVWMWGYNGYGQLGIGGTNNQARAYQINPSYFDNKAVTRVIGAGGNYGYFHAVADDGSVHAWGYNGYGQLGNGNTAQQTTPVPIAIATPVKSVRSTGSGSYGTTYFLCENGDVHSVGYNAYGQLGDGSTANRSTLLKLAGLSAVRDLYCGGGNYTFALAVKTDGTLHSWGHNGYGQLGNGDAVQQNAPGQRTVAGAAGVKQVSCGGTGSYGQTYLLDSEGKAFACGYNGNGQLGMGDTAQRNSFQMVHLPAGCQGVVKEIGGYSNSSSTDGVWLLDDGRLFVCGASSSYSAGQHPNGAVYIPQPVHM